MTAAGGAADGAVREVPAREWAAALGPPSDGAAEAPARQWRCFFCDEVFTDTGPARVHFGLEQDCEPGCVARLTADEAALRREVVEAHRERDVERLAARAAEETAESAHGELAQLGRFFPGARSAYDAWCQFESMEGRALAAEAILGELERQLPELVTAAREKVCRPIGAGAEGGA